MTQESTFDEPKVSMINGLHNFIVSVLGASYSLEKNSGSGRDEVLQALEIKNAQVCTVCAHASRVIIKSSRLMQISRLMTAQESTNMVQHKSNLSSRLYS